MWKDLSLVRIYTKKPNAKPDFSGNFNKNLKNKLDPVILT